MINLKGKYSEADVMIDTVEDQCVSQINTFLNHSAFTNKVVIMPDTHAGKGSVIGFTMKMTEKIIPNVIGVDIGCGMHSINIGKTLPLSLEKLDNKIRQQIPFGANVHDNAMMHLKNEFPWKAASVKAEKFAMQYREITGSKIDIPYFSEDWFLNKCKTLGGNVRRFINSMGTLGGGNHFIETGISDSGEFWITVHSGSRNFGKRVCEYWQGKAAKRLKKIQKDDIQEKIKGLRDNYSGEDIENQIDLLRESYGLNNVNNSGLEWLEGDMASEYLMDMIFAQTYAETNRKIMIEIISRILKVDPEDAIETIHNFIDFDDFIIRKGAIRSYENERMIIPFNMRDGLLICEGKSNESWNYSAPHGAGRVMSRTKAKKELDVERFRKQMEGIYSTSVGNSTLDECPDTYKSSTMIEEAIKDTAKIITKVKPVHNMKDSGIFKKHSSRRR